MNQRKSKKQGRNADGGSGSLRQSEKDLEIKKLKELQKEERSKIVLWRQPITTLYYFSQEFMYEISKLVIGLLKHRVKVGVLLVVSTALLISYFLEGAHQPYIATIEHYVVWWSYWVGLGVLSSVGLGTGLHTFILYLGPFIATVTLAAFDCGSVDFPQPPYPNDIVCPDEVADYPITFWTVMSKVRLEAIMWGIGTALGELPPYFMARAARYSESATDDYEELEEVLHSRKRDPLTRAKQAVYQMVQRVGFFGILLCASIPNPLFDLAGITCGHFLIPFWTFFGATLIGKAIIKMHIQQIFVIIAFSEHHFEWAVELIGGVPYVGPMVQAPFSDFLEKQKARLHRKSGEKLVHESSVIQRLFGYFLLIMVVYFVLSIVHSMAQNYAKRRQEELHPNTNHKLQ